MKEESEPRKAGEDDRAAVPQPRARSRASSPGASETRRKRAASRGVPKEYCDDPAHTAMTAWRERKRREAAERGTAVTDAETEQPVTMARVTGAELLREMRALADRLAATGARLTETVGTLGDPTAVEVEVEALRTMAEQRAATAEAARADAERRAANADRMRITADEAAEEMSSALEAAQARTAEAERQLTDAARRARQPRLNRVRSEARAQTEAAKAAQEETRRQAQEHIRAVREETEERIAQAAEQGPPGDRGRRGPRQHARSAKPRPPRQPQGRQEAARPKLGVTQGRRTPRGRRRRAGRGSARRGDSRFGRQPSKETSGPGRGRPGADGGAHGRAGQDGCGAGPGGTTVRAGGPRGRPGDSDCRPAGPRRAGGTGTRPGPRERGQHRRGPAAREDPPSNAGEPVRLHGQRAAAVQLQFPQ